MTKLTLSRQIDDKHSVKATQVLEDKVYANLIKQKVGPTASTHRRLSMRPANGSRPMISGVDSWNIVAC